MIARPTRPLAWLVVFATLAEALVAIAHAGARHVRCAEHGELVHLAVGSPARDIATGAPSLTPSSAVEDEHDHCSVPVTTQRSADDPPAIATPVPTQGPRPVATPGAVPARQLVVYRFAPKNSPPA